MKPLRGATLALALTLLAAITCSWLAPLDSAAEQQAESGMKRALLSFATARSLNALISVAQETRIAVEPAGVGVSLAPGQLLDPLNDLIENFGDLMLLSSVIFGAEKLLIAAGAHWLISLALTLTALAWLALHLRSLAPPPLLSRLLLALLLVRFIVPVTAFTGELVFQTFLADTYQSSQTAIDSAMGQAKGTSFEGAAADNSTSLVERFRQWLANTGDLKGAITRLQQTLDQAIEHVVMLIVVFVLQTLVMPLLTLWLLVTLGRATLLSPAPVRQR
ncbi:MAG: hypothetical protein IPO00_17625 [Betaproteobacteria bacterium]|nr:hypothetical protein [Betaproteobacteria bacterium]